MNRAPRGRPSFADTQRERILALLREAGPRGVSKEELVFKHRWTQAAARIFELEQIGYGIRHDTRPGERFVFYVLESEPLELNSLPSASDWYEREHGVRPSDKPADGAPLFAGVERG